MAPKGLLIPVPALHVCVYVKVQREYQCVFIFSIVKSM